MMLRRFLDANGDIHFIAPGQEDGINPSWTEMKNLQGHQNQLSFPISLNGKKNTHE